MRAGRQDMRASTSPNDMAPLVVASAAPAPYDDSASRVTASAVSNPSMPGAATSRGPSFDSGGCGA